jgi:hypothetical protein
MGEINVNISSLDIMIQIGNRISKAIINLSKGTDLIDLTEYFQTTVIIILPILCL